MALLALLSFVDAGIGAGIDAALEATGQELVLLPSAWIVVTVAYLVGAIPFGLLIAKRVAGIDLRTFGSGNIGTSNAVRAMGRRWGFVVFCLDFLKGFLPVLACHYLVASHTETVPLLQVLTGTAAVLGHCFPIYLRFRGGKGVATGCGAIIAIDPWVFLCGGVVWVVTRVLTRYAGLAWLEQRMLLVDPHLVSFDAVTLLDVLEHIPDFQSLLSNVREWVFMSLPICAFVRPSSVAIHSDVRATRSGPMSMTATTGGGGGAAGADGARKLIEISRSFEAISFSALARQRTFAALQRMPYRKRTARGRMPGED
jgi:acyl-phosphate glycerol 3-phosphate acyltransferase